MSRTTKKPAQVYSPSTTPLKPLEPIVVPPTAGFVEALFTEIQALEQARVEAHRFPDHVLYTEIQAHVSSALNELFKQGRIKVGLTINDKYITTKTE